MNTYSIEHIEDKIKLLLVMQGYDKKEIRFKNGSDGRTLQYGYWKVINYNDLCYVMNHCPVTFTIHNWEDEDTGPLTAYIIKENATSAIG